jgi:hypothetical protein
MHKINTSGGYEGTEFETAAVLASLGPLGVVTMGTLPLSLIAFGWLRRRTIEDSLAPHDQQLKLRSMHCLNGRPRVARRSIEILQPRV